MLIEAPIQLLGPQPGLDGIPLLASKELCKVPSSWGHQPVSKKNGMVQAIFKNLTSSSPSCHPGFHRPASSCPGQRSGQPACQRLHPRLPNHCHSTLPSGQSALPGRILHNNASIEIDKRTFQHYLHIAPAKCRIQHCRCISCWRRTEMT